MNRAFLRQDMECGASAPLLEDLPRTTSRGRLLNTPPHHRARFGLTTFLLAALLPAPALAQSAAPTTNLSTIQSSAERPTVDWVRAGLNTNRPVWGIRGGLLWGLPSGPRPNDGPRGLIRLRYPVLTNGAYDLINFIAIEPVVGGHRGFSELERSELDRVPGKRLWALNATPSTASPTDLHPGELTRPGSSGERLAVHLGVERFQNGAQVSLTILQRSEAPDEIELAVHAQPGSAPMDYCILTATMGNKARARLLWLKEGAVSSLKLYPDYKGADFAPTRVFPLDDLRRTAAGDAVAAITTDEANPAAVEPFPGRPNWRYAGVPVTQYWKKPAGAWGPDLQVAVNARYTYWLSRQPVPGGIAFENFEMRERFQDGHRFVFGITRKGAGQL